jgi:sec-independent protein translocase protein TatB
MLNVGGGEFLIILLVALVVLGPQKLPDAARQVGKIVGEFRRISAGFQTEMKSALNDPVSKVTGASTPKSLTDVTKVAEVKPIDDVEQAAPAEPASNDEPDDPPDVSMFGDR